MTVCSRFKLIKRKMMVEEFINSFWGMGGVKGDLVMKKWRKSCGF